MKKWTSLEKQFPTFTEEVLIWTKDKSWYRGIRLRSVETTHGTNHVFDCNINGGSQEIHGATHFARINAPKEKE